MGNKHGIFHFFDYCSDLLTMTNSVTELLLNVAEAMLKCYRGYDLQYTFSMMLSYLKTKPPLMPEPSDGKISVLLFITEIVEH